MNTFVIAGRELRSIFNSVIGWLVLAGFLLVTGFFWAAMVSYYAVQSTEMMANPYGGAGLNFGDYLFAPYFGNTSVVLLMLCPALSMRLFSEELKQGTLELLLTSPVSTFQIVAGKFLGVLGFAAAMLACTWVGPLMLRFWGQPDYTAVAAGYLGLLLLAAAILSMGMLFSSMTSNQIVALVLTFAFSLVLWVLGWVDDAPDGVFDKISMLAHLDELFRGLLQASDLVYFAGFIGFFVFATWQRVDSYRWS